ncbi:unnamed protein product [Owenia fusiformis]|uniref:Uncharacterized protein n=1 Tax=Owenia fusiformis TaxID=6347 RepID=A0A8J1U0E1_OWEFU|nr:unnamed protein product [Owenia fusiformis]
MPIQKVKKEIPRDILHGNSSPQYNGQQNAGGPGLNALRSQLSSQGPNTNTKPPIPPLDENALDITSIKGIFGWTTVDGVSLPYLFREAKYVAVRMVELKLLFKYPNAYPEELKKRPPLMSHYVTEAEAKLLNEINIEHCESEFGRHQFTVKDLVVRLEEFKDFYKIVKEAFPETDNSRESKDEGDVQGGWLQINNTVIPYILRNPVGKLVPLSVVQYAAELLNGVQIDGTTLPTEKECTYFNDSCKKAGLNFYFGRTTKLMKLTQVTQLCKLDVLEVNELPKDNPFGAARFKNIPYPTRNGYSNQKGPGSYMGGNPRQGRPGQPNMGGHRGPPPPYYPPGMMSGMQRPISGTTGGQRGSSGTTNVRYPTQRNPNTQSAQGANNPPQRVANSANDPRGPPNVMISQSGWPPRVPQQAQGTVFVPPQYTQGSFHQMQIMNGQMVPIAGSRPGGQSGTLTAKPGASQSQTPNPTSKKLTETLPCKNNRPRVPLEETRAAQTRPSTIQKQPMSSMSYHVSSMLQNSIAPIEFHKKTVSCLSTNNDKWALMEAIGKLYFPYCTMDEFQEALEIVLRCPVRSLTLEEERAFIEFYGLRTNSLNCNKVVKLDDLEKYMTQLKYMFQDKEEKFNNTADTNANKRKSSDSLHRDLSGKKHKANNEGNPGATTIVMNGDDVILIE